MVQHSVPLIGIDNECASATWGQVEESLQEKAGRQGGKGGGGTAQPLLSPILVLGPAPHPPLPTLPGRDPPHAARPAPLAPAAPQMLGATIPPRGAQ